MVASRVGSQGFLVGTLHLGGQREHSVLKFTTEEAEKVLHTPRKHPCEKDPEVRRRRRGDEDWGLSNRHIYGSHKSLQGGLQNISPLAWVLTEEKGCRLSMLTIPSGFQACLYVLFPFLYVPYTSQVKKKKFYSFVLYWQTSLVHRCPKNYFLYFFNC